jgi:uncharacterized protein YaaQ
MNTSIHLLLFAVVQEQDQDSATRALEQLRLPVVHLASAGGFLGRRNTTLLVGLQRGRAGSASNISPFRWKGRLFPCRRLSP